MTGRLVRTALIRLVPFLWAAAIAAAFFGGDKVRVVFPIGLMALAGTLCGAMREMSDRRGRRNAETAELILQAVLATRTQPADDQGLRLVPDAETGSELPPHRQSAG